MIIKIASLAAVLLLTAAPRRAAAQAPNPANPTNRLEVATQAGTPTAAKQSVADLTASMAKTQQCFNVENSLKADLAQKKAEITAEFGGRVPPAFAELLWQKSERISRQHKVCFQQYEELGKLLELGRAGLRTLDSTKPDYEKYKTQIDAINVKFSAMQPTTKTAPAGKPRGKN